MGEMVDDQTANQSTNLLKKGKKIKKKNHHFWNSRISVLVVVMSLLLHPDLSVCVSWAGLGTLLWQVAGGWGPTSLWWRPLAEVK
jgi:hypothetical protein